MKPVMKVLTILSVFMLGLASACRGGAELYLYLGGKEAARGNYQAAAGLMEKSQRFESRNPKLFYRLGLMYYKQGLRNKNPDDLEKASACFEKLKPYLPGRAWMYSALTELAKARMTKKNLSAQEWIGIRKSVSNALANEPGSALVAYHSGKILLSQGQGLSAEDRREALLLLRRSSELHAEPLGSEFLPKASLYLRFVLAYVWKKYHSPGVLAVVTPADRASYKELLAFLDQENLWQYRDRFYRAYLEFEEKEYDKFCAAGLSDFNQGKFKDALKHFKKAFYARNWNFQTAKAGILMSEAALGTLTNGPHALFNDPLTPVLKRVLEEEGEALEPCHARLGKAVEITGDSYLRGLSAYHEGRYKDAEKFLSEADDREILKRRYRAMAALQLGDKKRAADILMPALQEKDPDVREVLLLKQTNVVPLADIVRQAEAIVSRLIPDFYWRAENGKSSLGVNLMPGKCRLVFHFREKTEKNVYVIFYLDGRPLPGVWLLQEGLGEAVFETVTPGGKHWIEIETLNMPDILKPSASEFSYENGGSGPS